MTSSLKASRERPLNIVCAYCGVTDERHWMTSFDGGPWHCPFAIGCAWRRIVRLFSRSERAS